MSAAAFLRIAMPRITGRHAVVADGEVVQRALGLGAPVPVGSGPRSAPMLSVSVLGPPRLGRVGRWACARRTWRSMTRRTTGPRHQPANAGSRVIGSAVTTRRSRSMPRTIALADRRWRLRLDGRRHGRRRRRLELVLGREPRRVGVGRVRARHHDAVGLELGAQRLGEPRTANFVGAYAE